MRLEPFALLQLETKTKALPFKQLRRIDRVSSEQSSIFGDKHTARTTIGGTTAQISTSREPRYVRGILKEHCVSSDGRK
jgi:hypothetical protein